MKPHIVIYCCANSTTMPEDPVEKLISQGKASIQIVRLPCSGRTDVLYILQAIERGADMALVVGCPEGQCQFLEGNLRARMRVAYADRLLAEAGMGRGRVKMVNIDSSDPGKLGAALQQTITRAFQLGLQQSLEDAAPGTVDMPSVAS